MQRTLRNILLVVVALVAAYAGYERSTAPADGGAYAGGDAAIARAFDERRTGYQVQGSGRVERLLADDNDGSRHQRFVLRLASGQTVMVAHNIDLAPRVASLRKGDTVAFFGEYEWNPQGGVIHWTHHDPQGRHVGGWLEHDGRRYE